MTKKAEIQKPEAQSTALAGPSPYARSFAVPADLQRFLQVPAIHLHQGTISKKTYGPFPEGTLINTSTKLEIKSRKFILLSSGFVEYVKFSEDGNGRPEYKYRDRKMVPPGDLEWQDNLPPACTTIWYGPALFEGEDSPVAIQIKMNNKHRTKAYSLLSQIEQARAAQGKSPPLWQYDTLEVSNDQGQWLEPKFVNLGDPPESFLKQAAQWFEAAQTAQVHESATEAFDPDAE